MSKKIVLFNARQAKALDLKAREKYGISTLVLMENAGRAVYEEAASFSGKKRKIAIFCGCGNNGGDGFVAARHFLSEGVKPEVFLAGDAGCLKNEALTNFRILRGLGQKIFPVREQSLYHLKNKIGKYDLVIDALLGVGLKGQVRGIYKELIGLINSSRAKVISVDIPSGLDASSGRILGCCVKAGKTVTFMAKKKGMVSGQGRKFCGTVVVRGLGVAL